MSDKIKLELSEDEINKISKTARDLKFNDDKKILYDKDSIELLDNFISSYKFLKALSNNIKLTQENLSKRIKNYVEYHNEMFKMLRKFEVELKTDSEYKKINISKDLNVFISENEEILRDFVNTTYPIGKRIKTYDPDEAIGLT